MVIRIHRAGQGRSTDCELADRLEQAMPRSCRKAEDVLVAARKYIDRPGLFRSQKSLIQNLQQAIYALRDALLDEKYATNPGQSPKELLFAYLSEFSDAYPNWQREYDVLNRFIPRCF